MKVIILVSFCCCCHDQIPKKKKLKQGRFIKASNLVHSYRAGLAAGESSDNHKLLAVRKQREQTENMVRLSKFQG